MAMLDRSVLVDLYITKKKSMSETAHDLGCSLHTVSYWIDRYQIPTRSRSEATYVKRNPSGDPFSFRHPQDAEEAILFGIGIGLYWGEGNKRNKNSIRLGNTDPDLILSFIKFLNVIFNIRAEKLKFGLQIFSDTDPDIALDFWAKKT